MSTQEFPDKDPRAFLTGTAGPHENRLGKRRKMSGGGGRGWGVGEGEMWLGMGTSSWRQGWGGGVGSRTVRGWKGAGIRYGV